MVVERHQLGVGPVPMPPIGKGLSGRKEKVDHGHDWYSRAGFCCAAQQFVVALRKNQQCRCNPAMHRRATARARRERGMAMTANDPTPNRSKLARLLQEAGSVFDPE